MKQWFLDTNVVVDFLANRQPFVQEAEVLFRLAYARRVQLYVASLSFSHMFYLLRRTHGAEVTRQLLTDLLPIVQVLSVDASTVQQALAAGFPDFEDALQYFAATAVPSITAIVTRDPKGFRASALPILTPAEAVAQAIADS
ncbi:type II toxin-antitoxin system VapC family toxin [Hymenobacter cellulosilyticus]|uniref:PIN domain-containing protein n=1 Tax=Hymenobacter cellulosilyticus TaxID=2932248 RepID=A0A8T9QEC8_9BACT|nr:PIN domain-containing protein [Hymenobacter cellulosilyticus]UOQ74508.1 PIN domain-containing protein [Hymenobacter cellulosilyticus]